MTLSFSQSRSPALRKGRAFGMVELLIAIALIAILTALLVGVGSRVLDGSRKTRCLKNIRQIGVAISLYVNDHGGRLPGPMTDGQRLGYDLAYSDRFHIPRMLGHYLDLPPARSDLQFASSISCGMWLKQLRPGANFFKTPAYIFQTITVDGTVMRPFGRTAGEKPPMRYAAIPEPAMRKAMIEADGGIAPAWSQQLPAEPIHGGPGRHTLFFDWRVEYSP